MDKEFVLLEKIEEKQNITQRELSEHAGLSLGSVNLLLQKMAREGLIKMEQIPANRVAYMLTPKGMAEKVRKTYEYVLRNYAAIEEQKLKIRRVLQEAVDQYGRVCVLMPNDSMAGLITLAAEGFPPSQVILWSGETENLPATLSVIAVADPDIGQKLQEAGYRVIGLLG